MIKGKTVSLRPVEPPDAALMMEWWSNPRVVDCHESRWPTRRAEIEERVNRKPDLQKQGEFLIILTESAATNKEVIVGHISFDTPMEPVMVRCFDMGFAIHPDHRRNGYASQAGRLLVDRLFRATTIQRVQAHCRATNEGSAGVIEAIGMSQEGTLRSYVLVDGCYQDAHLFSILRPEWIDSPSYAARFGGL